MLWLYQKMFFMGVNEKVANLNDMDMREIVTLLPMVVLVFWIGIYPNSFLSFMHVSVSHLLERVNGGGAADMNLAQTVMDLMK